MLRFALDGRDAERFLRFYYKLDLRLKRRVLQDVLARYGGDAPVLDVLLDSGQIEPGRRPPEGPADPLFQAARAGRLRRAPAHFQYMGYGDYLSTRHADAARVNILLSLARQSSGIQGLLDRLTRSSGWWRGRSATPTAPLSCPPSTPARGWSTTGWS